MDAFEGAKIMCLYLKIIE